MTQTIIDEDGISWNYAITPLGELRWNDVCMIITPNDNPDNRYLRVNCGMIVSNSIPLIKQQYKRMTGHDYHDGYSLCNPKRDDVP